MFDIKLSLSDLFEIICCLNLANEDLIIDDNIADRQRIITAIFCQYRDQVKSGTVHPDAQIPDSIYAPDPEDFEEVSPNAD